MHHGTGTMLASCSGDKTVRIWTENSRSNAWECSAILEETHHRTIRSCSWSPDGKCLATASFDATTAIWERQVTDSTLIVCAALGSAQLLGTDSLPLKLCFKQREYMMPLTCRV